MNPKTTDVAALTGSALVDSGLRCPQCEYNLTGLTELRCPECGTVFDWDEIRRAAGNPPRIAFERARRWRKVPAFVATWATVLFAPWIFARQIVQRVSRRHGLAFAGICFAGTTLAYFSGMDRDFQATWLSTGLIYILLQTLWLSAWDPRVWQQPGETLRFWLLAGCYTSAVMLTEIVHGPPPLFLSNLWEVITMSDVDPWVSDLYRLDVPAVVYWAQLGLWLIALGCIYARRVARRRMSALVILVAFVVGFSLLNLYGASVQWIGGHISNWVRDWS